MFLEEKDAHHTDPENFRLISLNFEILNCSNRKLYNATILQIKR